MKKYFNFERHEDAYYIYFINVEKKFTKSGIKLFSLWMLVIFIITIMLYQFEWTGFGGRKAWDWLEIAIIPIVLGFLVIHFEKKQRESEIAIEHEREGREKVLEEKRREREEYQANKNRAQMIFESYIDRMTSLILDYGLLQDRKDNNEDIEIAKTRTRSVMRTLDEQWRGEVVRFVIETKIAILAKDIFHLTKFNGADLYKIDFKGMYLQNSDFSGCNLFRADFTAADTNFSIFENATLRTAVFKDSEAFGCKFVNTDIKNVNFLNCKISHSDFTNAFAENTRFSSKPAFYVDFTSTNLQKSEFSKMEISDTSFENANLNKSTFNNVDFRDVSFLNADLTDVDFTDCTFKRCNMKDANLSGVEFFEGFQSIDTNFNEADNTEYTKWPPGFHKNQKSKFIKKNGNSYRYFEQFTENEEKTFINIAKIITANVKANIVVLFRNYAPGLFEVIFDSLKSKYPMSMDDSIEKIVDKNNGKYNDTALKAVFKILLKTNAIKVHIGDDGLSEYYLSEKYMSKKAIKLQIDYIIYEYARSYQLPIPSLARIFDWDDNWLEKIDSLDESPYKHNLLFNFVTYETIEITDKLILDEFTYKQQKKYKEMLYEISRLTKVNPSHYFENFKPEIADLIFTIFKKRPLLPLADFKYSLLKHCEDKKELDSNSVLIFFSLLYWAGIYSNEGGGNNEGVVLMNEDVLSPDDVLLAHNLVLLIVAKKHRITYSEFKTITRINDPTIQELQNIPQNKYSLRLQDFPENFIL